MRTIPNRYPRRTPGGDYRDRCVSCMAEYYRKDLVLGPDNQLRCKDTCAAGREAVELGRASAMAARSARRPRYAGDRR